VFREGQDSGRPESLITGRHVTTLESGQRKR